MAPWGSSSVKPANRTGGPGRAFIDPRQRLRRPQKGGHPARVVVRPRGAGAPVIVRPHEEGRGPSPPLQVGHEVEVGPPPVGEGVAPGLKAQLPEPRFKERPLSGEGLVVLAPVAEPRELRHPPAQLLFIHQRGQIQIHGTHRAFIP